MTSTTTRSTRSVWSANGLFVPKNRTLIAFKRVSRRHPSLSISMSDPLFYLYTELLVNPSSSAFKRFGVIINHPSSTLASTLTRPLSDPRCIRLLLLRACRNFNGLFMTEQTRETIEFIVHTLVAKEATDINSAYSIGMTASNDSALPFQTTAHLHAPIHF